MLLVAFDELSAGRPHQMLARQFRACEEQREHVLQLIAKPERAARLIERAARPDATADVLIQEPLIDEHVK